VIGTTITQFLIEEQRRYPSATGDLTSVINDIVTACKAIASAMRYGALSDDDLLGISPSENVHGEVQKTLDIVANDLFLRRTEFGGHVAGMVSEEMDAVYQLPDHYPRGRYLLLYDPVDGSSGLGENTAIGTIFSILKRPDGAQGNPDIEEFLQPGTSQVCAGYAIYGPSSMIVMTTGNGANGFTLDPLVGEFTLSHPGMRIPDGRARLFANMADAGRWGEPIDRFVADCLAGPDGPFGRRYEVQWSGCAVADVHRVLTAGGIYINPLTDELRRRGLAGKLRLLYEANPFALIVEQAGGVARSGPGRILEIAPRDLHQRSPVILGARTEVERVLSSDGGGEPEGS
jgi:fructose-1,6-bisphosphatase I